MERYIVFDVETPNHLNNRMSAIGVTVVEGGRITDEFFSYVDPEQPFDAFNVRLTGISSATVQDAPTFPVLWERLAPLFGSGVLAAHNASFDIGVLRSCLRDYGIAWQPSVDGLCTVTMGRRLEPGVSHRLNDVCERRGIRLRHHQADSDSRACAEILLRYLADGADPAAFIRRYTMTPGPTAAPPRRDRAAALKGAYALQRHPEGGWFSEVYTAPFDKDGRALAGSIYFLLEKDDISHFHEIDCDELWFYHEGCGLRVTVLQGGRCETMLLGSHPSAGERAMVLVPAGAIFAAENLDPAGYTFLSCVTTPAFTYEGFRLVGQDELARHPACTPELLRLAFPSDN